MNEDKVNNVIKALSTSLEAQNRFPALRVQLEEKFSERPYQLMAVYQRNRHNRTEGEKWPDKPETAPAMSRYPNILAELDASGWWLDRIARCARVSMEIMATVMEDNGELSWDELESLARCFECKTDYLAAPTLSMVDPATNKGKSRIQRLRALLRQTEGMDRYFYRKNSSDVPPKLESGKSVTYASYRWACKNLQNVLDAQAREEVRQQSIRTGKLSPARTREKSRWI